MTKTLSRRDFNKLLALLPPAYFLPARIRHVQAAARPNIIILVYDAWSASNTSLYGYPRQTMPHLNQLAENAVVYHNHYAGGMFTYPGTASLLTGTLPWTHQAVYYNKRLNTFFDENNIFSLLDDYDRYSYTHNTIARLLLREMTSSIEHYIEHHMLYLSKNIHTPRLFSNDYDIASLSWVRAMKSVDDGFANSAFISRVLSALSNRAFAQIEEEFPLGLPGIEGDNYFVLEDATDWIIDQITETEVPMFGYFHLLPPHSPYNTRIEYFNTFRQDGYEPVDKPNHVFSPPESRTELLANRRAYDEYLLYVDQEFHRLYSKLERTGQLDNTWIILTSDHGEMFERGIKAHGIYALFEPLMKVPLLIFPPGQTGRIDVQAPTSAIDILPTLMHIASRPVPEWAEGRLIPPFAPNYPADRPIFSMDARFSPQEGPYTDASIMMRAGPHKLIYSFGHHGYYENLQGQPLYELYDLETDPEELDNLADSQPELFDALFDELQTKLRQMGRI
jgi:arylsulfatase A-like enzyme